MKTFVRLWQYLTEFYLEWQLSQRKTKQTLFSVIFSPKIV
jgi:hypothetical protein